MLAQLNSEDSGRTPGGRRKGGRDRVRTCLVSRETRPEAELIRFVQGPNGVIVADIRARLPGRGVWVSASRAAVDQAVRQAQFARALKAKVDVPADLADQAGRLLFDSALGRLGLARKAGQLAVGFTKVSNAIRGGEASIVLIAADAAADGRRKIAALMRHAQTSGDGGVPCDGLRLVDCWSAEELSLAIGRPNVIHAAVLRGAAGQSLEQAVMRFLTFEGQTGEDAGEPQDYDV